MFAVLPIDNTSTFTWSSRPPAALASYLARRERLFSLFSTPYRPHSDDSLSSDPIELPLPPLPGQSSKTREGSSKVPTEPDFGPPAASFASHTDAARRTPSPPLPSLTSQDQTVSESWHDERTPIAQQSRPEDFYTAQWGSPYDLPLPKRTRFASHRGTLSSEESPLRPLYRRASSPIEIDDEADPRFDLTLTRTNADSGTGRFRGRRTQDWLKAHIAYKRRGEKKNWWSDEESEGSDADSSSAAVPTAGRKRRGRKSEFDDTWLALREEDRSRSRSVGQERSKSAYGSLRRPNRRITSSRFHRAAPSDATLTQAQWDELVAEEEQDELPDINMLAALSSGMQGIMPRRQSSRNTSKDLSSSDKPLPPAPLDRTASESPVGATKSSPDLTKRPTLPGGANSFQRQKKKVAWRGKTCVIALPLEDGKDENGAKKTYLTSSQVSDRMKDWEQKGFSTRGFDLSDGRNTYQKVRGQSRDIYPDPTEWRKEVSNRNFQVKVPNRAAWESYVRELQEEKLRKLGVLKDRPADESARQSPALSQVQMSRTDSSQNSRAPTAMSNAMGSSVNGFRGPQGDSTFSPASFASPDGIQSRQSMISPVNQLASISPAVNQPGGFHAPKQSIAFLPGQGFVNLQFPQPQPTPPPAAALNAQNLMNSQNLLSSQPGSRGASPAIMDFHNRRMSILTTPQPMAQQLLNQNNDSALLRQQQQQLQQSMMQGRQAPPQARPEAQSVDGNQADDMSGPAIYSQPSHIASPMPQGHKHNVSESLQREIDEAEYHLEESIRKQLEVNEGPQNEQKKPIAAGEERAKTPEVNDDGKKPEKTDPKAEKIEADLTTSASSTSSPAPKSAAISRSNSKPGHAKKPSTSKLRAGAPAFVFDPTKSFTPSGTFSFGGQFNASKPAQQQQPSVPAPFQFGKKSTPSHSKSSSIASNLNAIAREFVPGGANFSPRAETNFSFQSSVPGIKTDASTPTRLRSAANSISSVTPSESGSAERPGTKMFGNFNFSEMVKPERKSKAIPIVKPTMEKPTTPPPEKQGYAVTPGGGERLETKRREFRDDKPDADEVPKFALPTPEPALVEQMRIAQQQVKEATPEPPTLRSTHTPPPDASQNTNQVSEGVENKVVSAPAPAPATLPGQPIEESAAKPDNIPAPSAQGSHQLQMPKVDTAIPAQTAQESVDWAETPLDGPFSRQNLDKAFAQKPREDSIIEEPVAEAKAEEALVRKPSPRNAAVPIVQPDNAKQAEPLVSVDSQEEHKTIVEPAKASTPQPASAAVPIVKPEEAKQVEVPKSAGAAIPIVKPGEVKQAEVPAKVPTPKPTSAAIPIIKPEEARQAEAPAKALTPAPVTAAVPIVKPQEPEKIKPQAPLSIQQDARKAEAEDANKKRKTSPEEVQGSFNPAVAAFNPGASSFVPTTAASHFTFTAPEPATPEQEWPEVQRQRIIKAPPKLGIQSNKAAAATPAKGGLTGGGLLGTSRWAAAAQEKTPSPATRAPAAAVPEIKAPERDQSPPARGRKSQLVRERSPGPEPAATRTRERSPSPLINDVRKGFNFSSFGDRLAAARKTSPQREPSPPVRGRGNKGSATRALSRSPSPVYNKGFNFSTYRDHQFAAPASPPPPPRSPSLAYSPPPGTPTPPPPPVPERSPSRPRADERQQQQQQEPVPDPVKRQPSQTRPQSTLRPRSPSMARSPSPAFLRPQPLNVEGKMRDGASYVQPSPTYQELDEAIKYLHGSDSDRYVERTPLVLSRAGSQARSKGPSPEQLISLSPVPDVREASHQGPTSDPNDLKKPFQYLPEEHEFGSSESVLAEMVQRNARFSPSFKPSRREDDMSPSRKMGHIAHRESVSDWNDVLSSSDEAKFHARTRFFDNKVNDEIGEVIQTRLRPLEQGLALLNKSLEQIQNERQGRRRGGRSQSADLPSDADDEDDEQPRGLSPVKDRKLERLKSAVLEAVNQQQQKNGVPEIEQMMMALADMKTQMAQQAANAPVAKDLDATIEDAIARHMVKSNAAVAAQDAAADDKLKAQITNLEAQLKAAEQNAKDEEKARQMAEEAVQGNQKLLRAAQEEASQQKETAEDTERSLKTFLDAQQESKQRMAMLEEAEEAMQSKVLQLSSKNEALEDTLEEYRLSHDDMKKDIETLRFEKEKMNDDWNKDINAGQAENEELQTTIEKLRGELEDGLQSRRTLKEKFDRLREDMAEAVKNVTRDQANWRQKEEEHNAKRELQSARLEAEARTRERLELEIDRLEKQEKEAMRARFLVEQIRGENIHLGSLVNELREKNHQYQDATATAKRETEDVKQRARTEIERMNKFLNTEAENSRSQASIVRKELDGVISNLKQQLEFAQQESNTAKSRFGEMLREANETKDKVLREAAEMRDAALQENYRFHEHQLEEVRQVHHDNVAAAAEEHARAIKEMQDRHQREMEELQMEQERAMRYANDDHKRLLDSALEDNRMTETYLRGRLSLADEKASHHTERIAHLEERLEIAKSAAQAAAEAAQKVSKKEVSARSPRASMASSVRPSMSLAGGSNVPEKISPQALRESIAVLQEQLHERESKIEKLEQELEPLRDLPDKVKEKDMEIGFVRELLDVRMDDLQDIIRTLSQPQGFSRERVRDAVIRLRANLQMEQQEKERAIAHSKDPNAPAPQPQLSLSGLRDMASSPRNVGLAAAAAWGNWRRGVSQPMSSLAEMAAGSSSAGDHNNAGSNSRGRGSSATPSRASPSSLLSGLLTPPASNLRSVTPTPATTQRSAAGHRRTSTASSARGARRQSYSSLKHPHHAQRPSLARVGTSEENRHAMLSELPQPDTPPGLLSKGSYDQDAEDGVYSLERYVNEREEDEHENETVIEEEEGEEPYGPQEDDSRYSAEAGHEAVGVVEEPFGPVIGA